MAANWNSELSGNPQFILAQNLKSLKPVLKSWNKSLFGNISSQVHSAEKKVLEVQELLDAGPMDPLHQSLAKAKANLHNCLQLKDIHWRKKSRIRWLKEGDRNTAFYHAYAKSRGSINHIDKIFYDGYWVDDQSQIQTLAVNHFSSVANFVHLNPSDLIFRIDSPKVTAYQDTLLSRTLDANEICRAVFALKKDSSPGPDGYIGYFFTATWQIMAPQWLKMCSTSSSSKSYTEPPILTSLP